jgi:hypothetical protein
MIAMSSHCTLYLLILYYRSIMALLLPALKWFQNKARRLSLSVDTFTELLESLSKFIKQELIATTPRNQFLWCISWHFSRTECSPVNSRSRRRWETLSEMSPDVDSILPSDTEGPAPPQQCHWPCASVWWRPLTSTSASRNALSTTGNYNSPLRK